jgi:2-oxo-4-hydroxy-4-carboxy-5-ureidoimidazoline decarboxylase
MTPAAGRPPRRRRTTAAAGRGAIVASGCRGVLLARKRRGREPDVVQNIDELNRLPDEAAAQALRQVCTSARWLDAMLAGRPYASQDALFTASDAGVSALSPADLREALDGHPRLGENPVAWSKQEQAGVMNADEAARRALAKGNAEYEQRFGHIYLACATGRTAGELVALLRERLGNDPETEWRVVAAELAKINQIRLRKLIGGAA